MGPLQLLYTATTLRQPRRMGKPPSRLKLYIFPELDTQNRPRSSDDVEKQCGASMSCGIKGPSTTSEGHAMATAVGRPWVGRGWAAHAGIGRYVS